MADKDQAALPAAEENLSDPNTLQGQQDAFAAAEAAKAAEVLAAAGEGAGADEGGAAPAAAGDKPEIGSEAWIDDPATDPKDLQAYLTGTLEPTKDEAAEAAAAGDESATKPAADEAAAAPAVADFKFTPDADAATFATEEAQYLDLVEVTPELQTILDRKNAEITALTETAASASTAFAGDESTGRHMAAFDLLVGDHRLDPELGAFVPNTDGVIGLLAKEYPNEMPQVVIDINSQPSTKYVGMTRYQEFIMDGFDIDAASMETLDYFLHNNGRMPVPAFVPDGIHPTLAQAFWTAENREELTTKIDKANWTLSKDPDATEAEKDLARGSLKTLNNQLVQIQNGLNAHQQRVADAKAAQQQAQTDIQHAAVDNFVTTTRGIIGIVAQKAVAGLEMMDADGAAITGAAFGTLIETAFSDNDGYAQYAQSELAKHGVTADWAKALETRDRLFNVEAKVVALEKAKAHPRAIELAKKEKDGVVKELLGLAHEAGGKINAKVVTGAGKQLQKQIEGAPRIAAVRPKSAGEGARSAAQIDYMDPSWTTEKLREEARKMQRGEGAYAAATRGDFSRF